MGKKQFFEKNENGRSYFFAPMTLKFFYNCRYEIKCNHFNDETYFEGFLFGKCPRPYYVSLTIKGGKRAKKFSCNTY